MAVLAYLPLVVVRAMGRMTGHVFFAVSARRRGVVLTNLKACFPQLTEPQRRQLAKRHFVLLGQSLWDFRYENFISILHSMSLARKKK